MSAFARAPQKEALAHVTVVFLEGFSPLATFTDPQLCERYVQAFEREFPEFRGMCRVERYACDPDVRAP